MTTTERYQASLEPKPGDGVCMDLPGLTPECKAMWAEKQACRLASSLPLGSQFCKELPSWTPLPERTRLFHSTHLHGGRHSSLVPEGHDGEVAPWLCLELPARCLACGTSFLQA